MKRLLSIVALLGLTGVGLNLAAQSTQATHDPTSAAQQQTDAANSQQSARSFEGNIMKSGTQLVLQESSTQTAYQLDDQGKAKQFRGKAVTVTATLDPNTNTLHVIVITPSENPSR